jgi:iron complex transport system permease protein
VGKRLALPVLLALLLALLAGSMIVGLLVGAEPVSPEALFVSRPGLEIDQDILFGLRLPRVLLAALVGAALSGAGVAFQAVLRNPLADPYILGVSGGAGLGATAAILLGAGQLAAGSALRQAAAFGGALLTLGILLLVARRRGGTSPVSLLLAGVVINAFFSALILFVVTAADSTRLQQIFRWLVGRTEVLPWGALLSMLVFLGLGLGVLAALSGRLNLLAFGEDTARTLGTDVERVRLLAILAASLVTAAAVSFAGLVGFVGLMVPHALRLVVGPDHRRLLPAAVLGGAAFLVLADALARWVVAPGELPVGVVTALTGGPLFLWLFARRASGGTR